MVWRQHLRHSQSEEIGPLGELLEPSGTLAFEDAVNEYARIVRAGVAAGADLIFFETFTDLYELKAALLRKFRILLQQQVITSVPT